MYEHLFIFSYLENLHFLSRAFPHFKISIPKKNTKPLHNVQGFTRVGNRTRTDDNQNHNLGL